MVAPLLSLIVLDGPVVLSLPIFLPPGLLGKQEFFYGGNAGFV